MEIGLVENVIRVGRITKSLPDCFGRDLWED